MTQINSPVDGDAAREIMAANTITFGKPVKVRDHTGEVAALLQVVPERYKVLSHDLTAYRTQPPRKQGHVTLHTADSFVTYVAQHGEDEATTLYADVTSSIITAVLNGHANDWTGWGDHTATLTLRPTPAWTRWVSRNGKFFPQRDFAEFVEDSLADFIDPTAAHMLELAQTFSAKSNVDFESGTRLDSGQRQLTYVENTTARAGHKGALDVPERVEVGLAPFEGGPTVKVKGWLRYRINDGNLSLGIKLERVEDVVRLAFDDTLNDVITALDGKVDGLVAVHGARA